MKFERVLTGIIGFPIVAVVLIFGNQYIIDILFSIIAIMSLYEYFKAVEKKAKPVKWVGYLSCSLIALIHVIPMEYFVYILGAFVPTIILILFCSIIFSNMKITIIDIITTFFGIAYIALFISFIPLLMAVENGKLLIWYIIFAAWGTDTFAYIVGMKFGKRKITKISPKKSSEGCIGGTVAAVILFVGYTVILNNYFGMNINYIFIAITGLVLSLIGQIGDLSASTIKRFCEIKDYSNLFPGHGGMLDRIDSIIFIAPFAYFLLMLING